MSNPDLPNPKEQPRNLTGGFELQTKIRLIIQQVLAATIRKLSNFGEKIEKFEEYFITFKQRFETAERERSRQQEEMSKIEDKQVSIRRDLNFNDIRYTEDKERATILNKEKENQFSDIEKQVKTLLRQNQNINAQVSKTKSKFLEYSNIISTLKEEVSWKITKYLQQTAESHTQMRVYSENIKNQYFNINLAIDKQKQKYDEIIIKYEEDNAFKQQVLARVADLQLENKNRQDEIQKLNTKVDDNEFAFLSKIKTADAKFDVKMAELEKNNTKLTNVFKKVESFNSIIDNIKSEIEQNHQSLTKKIEDTLKKAKQHSSDEFIKMAKDNLKFEKNIDKKLGSLQQKIDKQEDFFTQKLEFVKMEIESELSNKTSKMIQQKSKTEQHLSNSTMEEINGKMNKLQIETAKNLNKVELALKDSIIEVKHSIDKMKDEVEDKIEMMGSSVPRAEGTVSVSPISNQKLNSIYAEMTSIKQNIKQVGGKVQNLELLRENDDKILQQFKKKFEDKFMELQQKLNSKIEKVMFLVTKMRGDSIIRNEFNDKEIKQLKKNNIEVKERIETTWKLLPGLSECINLILSLIFDAQFQHSRIIQDSLPFVSKDAEKFNTCCEGVIYEFKQKRKPGSIFYRHSETKKTDLVKATFNSFISIWEQIFEGQLKNKQHLLPKGFYKRLVQKFLKQGGKPMAQKQQSSNSFSQLQPPQPRSSNNIIPEIIRHGSEANTNDVMSTSFHIRKKNKLSVKQKEKQEVSMVIHDDNVNIKQ